MKFINEKPCSMTAPLVGQTDIKISTVQILDIPSVVHTTALFNDTGFYNWSWSNFKCNFFMVFVVHFFSFLVLAIYFQQQQHFLQSCSCQAPFSLTLSENSGQLGQWNCLYYTWLWPLPHFFALEIYWSYLNHKSHKSSRFPSHHILMANLLYVSWVKCIKCIHYRKVSGIKCFFYLQY